MYARSLEWSLAAVTRLAFPSSTWFTPLRICARLDVLLQVIASRRIVKEVKEAQNRIVVPPSIDSERKSFYSQPIDSFHSTLLHRTASHDIFRLRSRRRFYVDRRRSFQDQDCAEIWSRRFGYSVNASSRNQQLWIHHSLRYASSTTLIVDIQSRHSQTTHFRRRYSRLRRCVTVRFQLGWIEFLEWTEEGITKRSKDSRKGSEGADAYTAGDRIGRYAAAVWCGRNGAGYAEWTDGLSKNRRCRIWLVWRRLWGSGSE